MKKLSDKELIEAYMVALKIDNIAKEFINLLKEELMNRSLFFKF
ncbi:sporulation histidine kinase inhibitor Sda [Bacillus sp. EB600]|nr:sporulation histidine kinase inhibitor Sda [Bacillus sp. EB600]MCQ6281590.1 sporulation histidine kinase inhibitor Sda [Bacillus sp. EB600]